MEGLLVIIVGIAIFSAIMFSAVFNRRGEWTTAFQSLAQRYGGWYSPAGVFRRPAATFTYKDVPCQVRCRANRRTGLRAETEFKIQWPIKRMKMQVMCNLGESRRHRGLGPTLIGDRAFDDQFDVFSSDQSVVTSVMNDEQRWELQTVPNIQVVKSMLSSGGVKWQIQQLASFLGDETVYISIHKSALRVVKPGYIKRPQALDDFVRYSLELYDQMMLTLSEGIEFTDENVVSAFELMQCPVCSSDVEGQMVICVRCKTPHCLDCWQYNGACGMFACGETRFMSIGASSPN